jgi:hypothetical protein
MLNGQCGTACGGANSQHISESKNVDLTEDWRMRAKVKLIGRKIDSLVLAILLLFTQLIQLLVF